MPIALNVDELEPQMCLAQNIYRGRQILLSEGKILQQQEIETLRRLMPRLSVRIAETLIDEFTEFENPAQNEAVAAKVHQQLSLAMTEIREIISQHQTLTNSDISCLQETIYSIIKYTNQNPVTAVQLIHSAEQPDYIQEHSANVCYLAILIGNTFRDYIYQERERSTKIKHLTVRYGMCLNPLALGCLLHDIGMIPIDYLHNKQEPLSAQDRARILQHPNAGVQMLPLSFDATARMIVRTHHENNDGSGYTNAIPSEKLHIFSRIIRVADAFEAGTSDRIYQQAKSPARILWEMYCGPNRHLYDPCVVKILLGLVRPFPIGARVQLGSGMDAVVVKHNPKHPFRPTVLLAFDEQGRKLEKYQLRPPINLAENDNIRIVSFAGEDLSFLDKSFCDMELSQDLPDADEIEASLFDLVYP